MTLTQLLIAVVGLGVLIQFLVPPTSLLIFSSAPAATTPIATDRHRNASP